MSSARCYNCPDKFQQKSATESQWQQLQLLLRENCHPYHSSSSDIPQLLSTAKDDLQRCNDEITKQQLYLVSLQKQRNILERHVQGYESLFSPIRKLPPEVLRQIFVVVCSRGSRLGHGVDIPALTLAGVCSHWGLVCSEIKELWSTIIFDPEPYPRDPGHSPALRFLLNKSDPHPLRLEILGLVDTPSARGLLRALAAESNRWSELTVGIDIDARLFNEFAVIRSRLPILRTLTLPYGVPHLDCFKVAPLLDTLDIDPEPEVPDLPWVQLRNLTLRATKRSISSIHFLSLCPALVSANLIFPSQYNVESANIHLQSNLSFLTIEVNQADLRVDLPLLSQLTLPALRSLSIKSHYTFYRVFPMARLQSLISRSQCIITTLSWAGIPTDFTQWISLLQSVPSLQSLSVQDFGRYKVGDDLVNDAFFDLLSGPTDSPFLPSLRHLSLVIANRNSLAFTTSSLIRALQIRWTRDDRRNIVCLKSFRLHLPWHSLDSQAIEPLKRLVGSGLDVVIRDKSDLVCLLS
ncbi:hypothetical protein C8J56DRAFT_498593 [Mycena floridula]|nr:hypothetical protein C8J56DRAFT_498593 [Mycena floridula]